MLLLAIGSLSHAHADDFGIVGNLSLGTSSAHHAKWKVGADIGALYDMHLRGQWYLQPRLLASYRVYELQGEPSIGSYSSVFGLTIPILFSYQIPLAANTNIRLNAGPYVQFDIFGQENHSMTDGKRTYLEKGAWHSSFGNRLSYGLNIGVGVEMSKTFIEVNYKQSPKSTALRLNGKESSVSVGVGLKF